MAGVDVCQKLSGVTLKLLAYERLLTEYPNHRDEARIKKIEVLTLFHKKHEHKRTGVTKL